MRVELAWRIARVANRRAALPPLVDNKSERVKVLDEGMAALTAALPLLEAHSQLHCWTAILLAKTAKSSKEKISNAYKIRDHAVRELAREQ